MLRGTWTQHLTLPLSSQSSRRLRSREPTSHVSSYFPTAGFALPFVFCGAGSKSRLAGRARCGSALPPALARLAAPRAYRARATQHAGFSPFPPHRTEFCLSQTLGPFVCHGNVALLRNLQPPSSPLGAPRCRCRAPEPWPLSVFEIGRVSVDIFTLMGCHTVGFQGASGDAAAGLLREAASRRLGQIEIARCQRPAGQAVLHFSCFLCF
jgi:hypothetical protein